MFDLPLKYLFFSILRRRRDRFHSRRRHRQQNIEDNIPQVYRPLLGCDDIDGLKKQANGVVHRVCAVFQIKININLIKILI